MSERFSPPSMLIDTHSHNATDTVCVACKGAGLRQPDALIRCEVCRGVGPFDVEGYGKQPSWRAGETSRMINGVKVYRCYADYLEC